MGRLHVVLVHPEIHWNTGNAGRTCLAVAAEMHLVQPLGISLDDKHVRRAGLAIWPRVPLRARRPAPLPRPPLLPALPDPSLDPFRADLRLLVELAEGGVRHGDGDG